MGPSLKEKIYWTKVLSGCKPSMEESPTWKKPPLEINFYWKKAFNGKKPQWKKSFTGKKPELKQKPIIEGSLHWI